MLLARYFLYVGGALLALLLIVSAELPRTPVAPSTNSAADMPEIRINSDRKWPAKVVFDTSVPTIVPTQVASNTTNVKAPVATAQVASSQIGPKATPREALAQLTPSDLKKTSVRRPEPRLRQRRKVFVARRRMYQPPMMVAQQPPFGFGFFGNRIW
jgi:hypothetical protein